MTELSGSSLSTHPGGGGGVFSKQEAMHIKEEPSSFFSGGGGSGGFLHLLAAVAAQELKTDKSLQHIDTSSIKLESSPMKPIPTPQSTFAPTSSKGPLQSRNSKTSQRQPRRFADYEFFNFDQIKKMSPVSLLRMFSEQDFDEMKRSYTYKCKLMPMKCSVVFNSFGSESRAKTQMRRHLVQHVQTIYKSDDKELLVKFNFESVLARKRRLEQQNVAQSEYYTQQQQYPPHLTNFKSEYNSGYGYVTHPKIEQPYQMGEAETAFEKENAVLSSSKRKKKEEPEVPFLSEISNEAEAKRPPSTVDHMQIKQEFIDQQILQQQQQQYEYSSRYEYQQAPPQETFVKLEDMAMDYQETVVNEEIVETHHEETVVSEPIEENQEAEISIVFANDHSYCSSSNIAIPPLIKGNAGVDPEADTEDDDDDDFYVDDTDELVQTVMQSKQAEDNEEEVEAENIALSGYIIEEEVIVPSDAHEVNSLQASSASLYQNCVPLIGAEVDIDHDPDFKVMKSADLPIISRTEHLNNKAKKSVANSNNNNNNSSNRRTPNNSQKEQALDAIKDLKSRGYTTDDLSCKLCQKDFTAYTTLLCHLRSHAGIRNYECELCPALFTRQHSLNYHKLIHDGKMRFTCHECGRQFRHPSHYKEHKRRHTGEFPFECSECHTKYKTRNTYKRHLKLNHGKLLTSSGSLVLLTNDEFEKVKAAEMKKERKATTTKKTNKQKKKSQEPQIKTNTIASSFEAFNEDSNSTVDFEVADLSERQAAIDRAMDGRSSTSSSVSSTNSSLMNDTSSLMNDDDAFSAAVATKGDEDESYNALNNGSITPQLPEFHSMPPKSAAKIQPEVQNFSSTTTATALATTAPSATALAASAISHNEDASSLKSASAISTFNGSSQIKSSITVPATTAVNGNTVQQQQLPLAQNRQLPTTATTVQLPVTNGAIKVQLPIKNGATATTVQLPKAGNTTSSVPLSAQGKKVFLAELNGKQVLLIPQITSQQNAQNKQQIQVVQVNSNTIKAQNGKAAQVQNIVFSKHGMKTSVPEVPKVAATIVSQSGPKVAKIVSEVPKVTTMVPEVPTVTALVPEVPKVAKIVHTQKQTVITNQGLNITAQNHIAQEDSQPVMEEVSHPVPIDGTQIVSIDNSQPGSVETSQPVLMSEVPQAVSVSEVSQSVAVEASSHPVSTDQSQPVFMSEVSSQPVSVSELPPLISSNSTSKLEQCLRYGSAAVAANQQQPAAAATSATLEATSATMEISTATSATSSELTSAISETESHLDILETAMQHIHEDPMDFITEMPDAPPTLLLSPSKINPNPYQQDQFQTPATRLSVDHNVYDPKRSPLENRHLVMRQLFGLPSTP